MKIKKIRLFRFDAPFKMAFHSPHLRRVRAEAVLSKIEFDNGLFGSGESTPRSYVTNETCSSVIEIFQNILAANLLDRNVECFEDVESILDDLENRCRLTGISHYLSALGATDIGLLDALGKLMEKPFHFFLGPARERHIPFSTTIPFMPISKIEDIIENLGTTDLFFSGVKVIMGPDEKENLERVRRIRQIFGASMEIRIEANGKWSTDQAISCINKMEQFAICSVEQPVSPGDFAGLKRVKEGIGIPVVADESLCTLEDAKALASQKACDIFNIKLSKCGGLIRSRRIAEFSESEGLQCQVGGHVGQTEILTRAGRRFAYTLRNITCIEEGSHLLFEKTPIRREAGAGFSRHGLGLRIDTDTLPEICVISEETRTPLHSKTRNYRGHS